MEIPRGASLYDIARTGVVAGAPLSVSEFIAAAQRLDIATKLQAGHYEFAAGDSIHDMLGALAAGHVIAERLTIVEGITYRALRNMLSADTRVKQTAAVLSDEQLRRRLKVKTPSLEGLFLPETYFFNHGDSDLDILQRARQSMQKLLDNLWQQRGDDGVFNNVYEALTLASVVEKETAVAEERPLIASVFVNRLRRGIPLQADPTVIYGLGEQFDGNLTRAHLRDKKNPYNTYAHRGLTPTPIALPSAAAIAAVLNPPATSYYYFVATGDGRHVFSKTLREHNNAVNKYQRR